eukprot:3603392-Lingulodinium_polyedra.AAC.1
MPAVLGRTETCATASPTGHSSRATAAEPKLPPPNSAIPAMVAAPSQAAPLQSPQLGQPKLAPM